MYRLIPMILSIMLLLSLQPLTGGGEANKEYIPTAKDINLQFAYKVLGEFGTHASGGMYLDPDLETVHICLVLDRVERSKIAPKEGIIYHYVRYSEQELQEMMEAFYGHMVELGIQMVYVDVKENKLHVSVYQLTEEIRREIHALVPDPKMLEIQDVDWEFQPL